MEWLLAHYQWIKAIHIISVICWMAGLFYLPRLFVYHSENQHNRDFIKVAKIQEYKLFAYIMRPAMLFSVISGGLMIWLNLGIFKSGMWIHIKILFAIFLLIFHIACGMILAKMQNDSCKLSGKFFRVFNELPTILMIVIVFCAVLKF